MASAKKIGIEAPNVKNDGISEKELREYIQPRTFLHEPLRTLVNSLKPILYGSFANSGPPGVEREKVSEALGWLRKEGVLADIMVQSYEHKTLAIQVHEKYRNALREILAQTAKEKGEVPLQSRPTPAKKSAETDNVLTLKNKNEAFALRILLGTKERMRLDAVEQQSGLGTRKNRHIFWSQLLQNGWMRRKEIAVGTFITLTPTGRIEATRALEKSGHPLENATA